MLGALAWQTHYNKISIFRVKKRDAEVEMKNAGQPPASSVSAQSKLLRELGVRVYRYSSDEKRDIILRYLMKKNRRQSGERTIKFFTTRPPPGENFRQQQNNQPQKNVQQQQNVGGKLIVRAPLQGDSNGENRKISEDDAVLSHEFEAKNGDISSLPKTVMEEDEKLLEGLGTSTSKEGKEYFQDLQKHKKDFIWTDEQEQESSFLEHEEEES